VPTATGAKGKPTTPQEQLATRTTRNGLTREPMIRAASRSGRSGPAGYYGASRLQRSGVYAALRSISKKVRLHRSGPLCRFKVSILRGAARSSMWLRPGRCSV